MSHDGPPMSPGDNRPDDPMEVSSVRMQQFTFEERAENRRRKEKGLCLNCGELGHRADSCTAEPVGTAAQKYKKYWDERRKRGLAPYMGEP